jgi:hypothetical protein
MTEKESPIIEDVSPHYETKNVAALTFKPGCVSQHRYESKYFHEKI